MARRGLIAILLPLALVLAGSAAEAQRTAAPRQHVMRFLKSPLVAVVMRVSQITNQSFVFDPSLAGEITIQVPEPVDDEEALQILNTALMMNGFMTVEMQDGVRKIVPVSEMGANAPLLDGEPRPSSRDVVTTMVRLESMTPDEAAAAIRPLVGESGLVVPYPATQSLILASSEDRLHRLLGILRDLDSAGELQLVILTLRFYDAEAMAALIESELPPRQGQERSQSVIAATHSNSIVIQATPERIGRIREFVAALDVPQDGNGQLHVVPVLHTDPERLAVLLNSLSDVGDEAEGPLASSDYSVVVHAPTRSLLIQSSPATFRQLTEVIAKLDRVEPRISVDLILFEVSVSKSHRLGVDFIVPLTQPRSLDDLLVAISGQNSSADVLTSARGDSQPGVISRFVGTDVQIPIIDAAGNVRTLGLPVVHIVAQEQVAKLQVLQRPHLLLINGEDQEISVGNNIPIIVSAGAETGNPLETRQTIERHDIGIRLRLGATVGSEGPVRISVDLEQSDVAASVSGNVNNVGVTLQSRTLEATVYLMDGETALIGGLNAPRVTNDTNKVPYLSAIPAIGNLFQATRTVESDVHLMLALQARVLKTPAEDELETIRRRTTFERSLAGLSGLREVTDAPYALLLSSHRSRAYAEAEAREFADGPERAEVVEWTWDDRTRYDVYLIGFNQFADATEASHRARAAGWSPRVIVITSGLSD